MKLGKTIQACLLIGWVGIGLATGQESGTALQQVARVRADLEVVREDQRRLYLMLQENRRLLTVLQSQLSELSAQLEQLASSQSARGGAAQSDIEALRRTIRNESQAREKAIETVIDSLSREIAAVAAARSDSGRRAAGSQSPQPQWSGPVQGEYTVVRGDTLSAIAQAFNVSTNRLRQANNLSGDLIREGQVLIIPE